MKALYKRILIGLVILVLIVAVKTSSIGTYINLEYIRNNSHYIKDFIAQHYLVSVIAFICLYSIVVASAIPISPLLNMSAGYFFYTLPGTFFSIIGATLGAVYSFLIVRYLLRDGIQKKYTNGLQRFNHEIKMRGASYILFLQLLPVTPYSVIIILSALSPVSLVTFIWATALGIAPGSFIYACAGKQLMYISHFSDIISWPIMGLFLLLALFSLVPIIVQKRSVSK